MNTTHKPRIRPLSDTDQADDSCPGCGCRPGGGLTDGCEHPDGCGWSRSMGGDGMSALEQMTTVFFERFEALVEEYPRQAAWAQHHREWFAGARLARLRTPINSKGGYTSLARLTLVAVQPDEVMTSETGREMASIWCPGSTGTTKTLVAAEALLEVCETCLGSGRVHPHPEALVTVACPAC